VRLVEWEFELQIAPFDYLNVRGEMRRAKKSSLASLGSKISELVDRMRLPLGKVKSP
jgi:hypothetical protein